MARLSRRGSRNEAVRARARDLGGGGPAAIRGWLNRRFEFMRDPPGLELLKSPGVMLREWEQFGVVTGDCDDAAILAAAVSLAAGYRVRWIVLGFRPAAPFAHVYAEAWDGQKWQEFDVTRPAHIPAGLKTHRRLAIPLR